MKAVGTMNKTLFQRAKQVLTEVFEQRPDARSAYVARVCHDDPALHAEVCALLDAERASEHFIETPLFGHLRASLPTST
ncbi:MAG: hypothetical protein AAF772_16825 [Acidobacteriota bacterium]